MSSPTPTVLFVDDDEDVLTTAGILFRRGGWRMLSARSPAEAWSVLAGDAADVILLDLNFSRGATSGEEGFRFLSELKTHDPKAVVVVVTGHSGVNVAVRAMKSGASDFVMKPWSNARLLDTLSDALALRRREPAESSAGGEPLLLIGESPAIQRVRDLVARAGPTEASVLVRGPAGAGKTLVARLIHARSGRAERPLVTLDARRGGQLTDAVLEAEGGTLLVEEVSLLSAQAQGELLAALEGRADLRVIATARDPAAAETGVRDDLMARLGVVEIALPPLGARGADAVLLIEHFVRLFARRHGRNPMPLDEAAVARFSADPPPGEVRDLRLAAERAVVLSDADILTAADFLPAGAPAQAGSAQDLTLARTEKAAVEAALKRHGHNVSRAARELGLTRATLYRRMLKHGL